MCPLCRDCRHHLPKTIRRSGQQPLYAVDTAIPQATMRTFLQHSAALETSHLALRAAPSWARQVEVERLIGKLMSLVDLSLGNCRGSAILDGKPVDLDVNHEDLASMPNLARTTVGTILRQLEADGYVDLSYRRIVLL